MNSPLDILNSTIANADQSVQDIIDAPGNQQRRSPLKNRSKSLEPLSNTKGGSHG